MVALETRKKLIIWSQAFKARSHHFIPFCRTPPSSYVHPPIKVSVVVGSILEIKAQMILTIRDSLPTKDRPDRNLLIFLTDLWILMAATDRPMIFHQWLPSISDIHSHSGISRISIFFHHFCEPNRRMEVQSPHS